MTSCHHTHTIGRTKKLKKSLDNDTELWYIILMNNDMRTFEIWILISIVLFISTLAFGFYIESI